MNRALFPNKLRQLGGVKRRLLFAVLQVLANAGLLALLTIMSSQVSECPVGALWRVFHTPKKLFGTSYGVWNLLMRL